METISNYSIFLCSGCIYFHLLFNWCGFVWSNCNLYAYFILDWVNEWHCNFLLRNTFFPFFSLKHDKELELFAQNTAKQLWNVPRSLWADHILVVSYFRSNDFLFLKLPGHHLFETNNWPHICKWTWAWLNFFDHHSLRNLENTDDWSLLTSYIASILWESK